MSDLTASNCGCSGNDGRSGFGNNLIWIILLLAFCNGNNNGIGLLNNNDGWGNNSCDLLIWILLISCLCGNGCNN
ncbi:MAG: chorion class high-cysteine HCB protein 13 [Lachnospiraceae bacterium]|nr:chorion class high-cysteine HCB protein 13 [Lachnospiraceae bacterium]